MVRAPSAWASYLINGDASGITDEELAAAQHMALNEGPAESAHDWSEFDAYMDYGLEFGMGASSVYGCRKAPFDHATALTLNATAPRS